MSLNWTSTITATIAIKSVIIDSLRNRSERKIAPMPTSTAAPRFFFSSRSIAGTIRNNSSKSSGYTIHVKFKDASGNGVGDGAAVVAKVDPGATAKWDVTGTFNAKGKMNCELGTVARAAVP